MANSFSTQGATPGMFPTNNLASTFAKKKPPNPLIAAAQRIATPAVSTPPLGTTKGLLDTHTPTTPVKSISDVSGNTVSFHAPPVESPKTSSSPKAPQVGTPIQNAQTVLNSGEQTRNEQQTQQGLIKSGQATPLEEKYIGDVMEAKKMQNAGSLGQYADASLHTGDSPEQLYKGLIEAPDLVGRAGANKGLYDSFGNIYGSAATQGLLAANTIASRGTQAAQGAYTGAQTQAGRAQGGAGTVLESSLPAQSPYTNYRYNPLTGETQVNTSPFSGGQQSGLLALGQQYPALQSAHVQSQGIKNTIQKYLAENPNLNPVDATLVNAANQWIQGKQLGDPKYQTLMNYLNEYTNTLAPILGVGGDPTNLKTEIAQSFINAQASGQSISQVLDSIDKLASGKLQSMANVGQGNNTPSTPSSSGGGLYDF